MITKTPNNNNVESNRLVEAYEHYRDTLNHKIACMHQIRSTNDKGSFKEIYITNEIIEGWEPLTEKVSFIDIKNKMCYIYVSPSVDMQRRKELLDKLSKLAKRRRYCHDKIAEICV